MKSKVVSFGIRLLIALLLIFLGMTARTLSAGDEGNVRDTGLGIVQSCQQIGPVDIRYGFGLWNECKVLVKWDKAGYQSVETVRPPYLTGADIGHQVRVDQLYTGRNGGSDNNGVVVDGYPRLVWIFYVVTVPCFLAAIVVLMWPILRARRRRAHSVPADSEKERNSGSNSSTE